MVSECNVTVDWATAIYVVLVHDKLDPAHLFLLQINVYDRSLDHPCIFRLVHPRFLHEQVPQLWYCR
jgi:hypothetical protein